MKETRLTREESEVLKTVLSKLTIKKRTGEIGILHGMDRFVSTNLCLKKKKEKHLNPLLQKLALKVE